MERGNQESVPFVDKIQEQRTAVVAENGRWLPSLDKQKA
jgi:hypothetical protein